MQMIDLIKQGIMHNCHFSIVTDKNSPSFGIISGVYIENNRIIFSIAHP